MKIGVIYADLRGKRNHRFPNLCCMKISGFHKNRGDEVRLITDVNDLQDVQKVYIAKVFTSIPDPFENMTVSNAVPIIRGGTGYFFEKAEPLPYQMEHTMPDYHLYDKWAEGKSGTRYYSDYSIGYLTRGCFRKCKFCVNQKYSRAFEASQLEEFYDPARKKICLLDDNFLSHPKWKAMLEKVIFTGKPYQFKQGLDERILNEEMAEMIFNSKYDGEKIFAFDNLRDYPVIARKLEMIRKYTDEVVKFYVLCGFESTDIRDIEGVFKRIELLFSQGAIPYIMRYRSASDEPWKQSEFEWLYTTLARWCNQVRFCKKMTLKEFIQANQDLCKTDKWCKSYSGMKNFSEKYPLLYNKYFNMRFRRWV